MRIRSRWLTAALVLVPVGCSTAPVADFLDWAHPARVNTGSGPGYGGVEPAPHADPGAGPPVPPLPTLPDSPLPSPPAPVWPTAKPAEGPPRAVGDTPELPNFTRDGSR
jgi:hypothetical protein